MIHQKSNRQGVALILVLSFIVLVTTLIIAFFSRSILQRQVSATSGSKLRTDVLAQSALEVIIGDLKQEIAAGSTNSTLGTITIYTPSSNFTAIPFSPTNIDRAKQPNLLKTSAHQREFYSGTHYTSSGPNRASDAVSTGTSSNKRSISLARWNAPLLLSSTSADLTPKDFSAPHWIIVTRGDVGKHSTGVTITGTTMISGVHILGKNASGRPADKGLHNPAPGNTDYAIGRFAYVIYDEGGLLDINVAGNQLTAAQNAARGRLHQATLDAIPGFIATGTSSFLPWRTAATGSNASDVIGSGGLFDPQRDFISVQKTATTPDQTFFNRQDLIAYAKSSISPFNAVDTATNQPYPALKHLSTFSREKNAPSWVPASVTGTNPNLANVRKTDNTPLLTKRFPLSRIDLIRQNSGDVATYFGLSQAGHAWSYTHLNSSNAINTLDEVKVLNREPNFFELLKAGITAGSLGKNGKTGTASTNPSSTAGFSDLQILQIGANIIDQYDANNFPTELRLNGEQVYGIENLPYLVRVFGVHTVNPSDSSKVSGYLQPELWNPHQQSGSTIATSLRLRMVNNAQTQILSSGGSDLSPATGNNSMLTFTNSANYHTPKLLESLSPVAPDLVTLNGNSYAAFFTGEASLAPTHTEYNIVPATSFDLVLEYYDGSDFRPYSVWKGVASPLSNVPAAADTHSAFYVKADPRTDRFGVSIGTVSGLAAGSDGEVGKTIRPTTGVGMALASGLPTAGVTLPGRNLGLLSDNLPASSGFYTDPDGIVRKADGANRIGIDGLPLSPTSEGRGVILNRPFKSVGELGYAFRDLPFKSLDFFTAESADAALLDLFSVDDNEVMAGRINLNTRNWEVLKAMLLGAGKSEAGATISATEAETLAQAIVSYTSDLAPSNNKGPLTNRAQMVTKLEALIGNAWPANADKANKPRREAAIRALADVANTRTWNLMIDVIAQSGKYPPGITATSGSNALNQYFVVEGERRYWLHIAIDRYTGEIVSKQLETVSQ